MEIIGIPEITALTEFAAIRARAVAAQAQAAAIQTRVEIGMGRMIAETAMIGGQIAETTRLSLQGQMLAD
jgi:hypothetical protein